MRSCRIFCRSKKNNTVRANQKRGSMKERTMSSEKKNNCDRCGFRHELKKCPAYGQTCKKCEKKNHFAKVCRANSQKKSDQEFTDMDEEMFIGTIGMKNTAATEKAKCDDRWTEELNKRKLDFGLTPEQTVISQDILGFKA